MAFVPLRSRLSSVFIQRFYFLSSRASSGKPVAELVNVPPQGDHVKASRLETVPRNIPEETSLKSSSSKLQHVIGLGSDLNSSKITNGISLESLLHEAPSKLKTQEALHILLKLRSMCSKGDVNASTFINDSRFMKVCRVFQKGCASVRNDELASGLRCLLELGLSPKLELMQIVENEVLWKSRKMLVKTLCIILDFHVRFQETAQQVQIVEALASHVKNRWIEIEHASEVITILNNKDLFDTQFLEKVEDRILEFVDKIPKVQLVSLFTAFSSHKRRSESVLRALSYYLVQARDQLTLRQCCDLCFAFSSLHFIDGNILNRIAIDALSNLETNTSGPLLSSLLTSLSMLKWDHFALLESCCNWIEKNPDKWRKRDWVSLVLSLAHLNYRPENYDVLMSLALKSLKAPAGNDTPLPPNVWLDVVWALAVLGKATQKHLASALDPAFHNDLIKDEVRNSVINKLKLQNIDAVAKVELPLAKVPSLKVFEELQIPMSAADGKMIQTIIESLETYLPTPKYLAVNLNTNMGFNIIGEFIVDENGKPVPIVDYGVKGGITEELKRLPPNFKRIALLYWSFKDVTNKTYSVTGVNALSVRLLTKLGYTVVEVSYQEYQTLRTTLQRVMYLQQKTRDKISANN